MNRLLENTLDKAFAYRKTKFWTRLSFEPLFALRQSDGSLNFLLLLGNSREYIGFSLLPGAEGLQYLRIMRETSAEDSVNISRLQASWNCINLCFTSRDQLYPPELSAVRTYCKKHGINLRGKNAWPQFERYTPTRIHWMLESEKELLWVNEALSVCLALAGLPDEGLSPLLERDSSLTPGRVLPCATVAPDGSVNWGREKLPPIFKKRYPTEVLYDELLAKKVQKKKKNGESWEFDIISAPQLIDDDEEEIDSVFGPIPAAPRFPWVGICMDGKGFVTAQVLEGSYDAAAVNLLLEFILEKGRPYSIHVQNQQSYAALLHVCSRLGIRLKKVPHLPDISGASDMLCRSLQEKHLEEEFAEDPREFLDSKKSPAPGDADFDAFWDRLSPAEQREFARAMYNIMQENG